MDLHFLTCCVFILMELTIVLIAFLIHRCQILPVTRFISKIKIPPLLTLVSISVWGQEAIVLCIKQRSD